MNTSLFQNRFICAPFFCQLARVMPIVHTTQSVKERGELSGFGNENEWKLFTMTRWGRSLINKMISCLSLHDEINCLYFRINNQSKCKNSGFRRQFILYLKKKIHPFTMSTYNRCLIDMFGIQIYENSI